MISSSERKSKVWAVIRVSSGNFLEMYDFMVFGYITERKKKNRQQLHQKCI